MASNGVLQKVRNRGWAQGFSNLFGKESGHWWKTWQWVIQALIWMAIVNGMLAMVVLVAPRADEARARAEAARGAAETSGAAPAAQPDDGSADETALMVFFIFSGMAPAVGVVILGQEAIIQEKQTGTAAWVLSKPVSRSAFVLSKLAADALGVLVTMVIVQGISAYLIIRTGTGRTLPPGGFAAALGLVYLLLLFYLSLTVMLGTLFQSRGPVIGIPMVFIFGNQLAGLAPWLGQIMPWNLVFDLGPNQPSLAVTLAQGLPLPTYTPVVGTLLLSLICVGVALWRFEREEF